MSGIHIYGHIVSEIAQASLNGSRDAFGRFTGYTALRLTLCPDGQFQPSRHYAAATLSIYAQRAAASALRCRLATSLFFRFAYKPAKRSSHTRTLAFDIFFMQHTASCLYIEYRHYIRRRDDFKFHHAASRPSGVNIFIGACRCGSVVQLYRARLRPYFDI